MGTSGRARSVRAAACQPAAKSPLRPPVSASTLQTLFAWVKDSAGHVSAGVSAKTNITIPPISGVPKSITSTSQNRSSLPTTLVPERSAQRLSGYQILAANDAYAALKVLEAIGLPREELPIMGLSRPEQHSDSADL